MNRNSNYHISKKSLETQDFNDSRTYLHKFETPSITPKNINFTCMKEYIPLEEGDYYLSDEGYRVFTEQYHLKRGYCCESNCRHCPYGFNAKLK